MLSQLLFSPVSNLATLAGKSTGYTVRLFRNLTGGQKSPRSFKDTIKNAILAEIRKTGIDLSEGYVEKLVEKVVDIIEQVLRGDISLETILAESDFLKDRGMLSDFLAFMSTEGGLTEGKMEILRRILEENIEIRQLK